MSKTLYCGAILSIAQRLDAIDKIMDSLLWLLIPLISHQSRHCWRLRYIYKMLRCFGAAILPRLLVYLNLKVRSTNRAVKKLG
ncbi:hypothetical protein [Microcoleus sp. bin38.metabat.b11b12b14.051]|uniref:hypothetical protein n=1 Tax=Microcoleus sp. bin38.metabat.b11b12b14.051 TaxID=2742709 RepID=UPI0025DACD6C|nr:hypothetical protein [Microcoleus sp. bin38.metabat.b11b12b14.051]